MKKVIIVFALIAGSLASNAQAMNNSKFEESKSANEQVAVHHDNLFSKTELSKNGMVISFSSLPQTTKPTWAVLTDAEGNELIRRKVSPADNTMEVKKLTSGGMYFVTLVYRNKSQKGFVLHN